MLAEGSGALSDYRVGGVEKQEGSAECKVGLIL